MRISILFSAALGLGAAGPAWGLTPLVIDAEQSARIQLVIAAPDGGFSVFLTDATIAHFDAGALPAGTDVLPGRRHPSTSLAQYPGRWSGTADAAGNFRILVEDSSPTYLPDPDRGMDIAASCTVDRLSSGRFLTRLSSAHAGGAYSISSAVDADGGSWMYFHTGHLVRFAADCRADTIAVTDQDVIELAVDPTDRAVYFLTTDRKLHRLSVDGIDDWSRDLSNDVDGWASIWGRLIVSDRGDAVLSYTEAGSFATVLVSIDAAGNQRWIRPLADGLVMDMTARDDAILVAAHSEVLLFDTDGRLLWQDTGPGQAGVRGSNAILPSPNGSSTWIEFNPDQDPDVLPVMRFDNATGAGDYWLPEWGLQPVSGQADGSLLFVGATLDRYWSQDGGHALYIGRPDGSLEAVALPPDLAADRIVANRSDNHGTVSVVEHDGGWTLFSHDAQLRAQWRRRETGHASSVDASYQLATGQEVVCLLVHEPVWGKGASQARLFCHDRLNGQPLFEPHAWHAREAVMHVEIGDSVEVVFYDELASTKLRRILIDHSGLVLEPPSRFRPMTDTTSKIQAVWFQADGSLLVRWDVDTLQFIPADPELGIQSHPHETHSPNTGLNLGQRTLAYGHDRFLRLGYGHDPARTDSRNTVVELRMYTAAGDPQFVPGSWPPRHWEFPLQLGGWHQYLVTATEEGWLVAILAGEHLWVQTLSVAGETIRPPSIVRINVGPDDADISRGVGLLSWDGQRLMVAIPNASATRLQWFDPVSGTLTAAASARLLPQHNLLAGVRANGTVVVAGEALGPGFRRPALWQVSAHARRPLQQPEHSFFNGAWYDRSTSGQGFFIDSMGTTNQLFGAWFTFSTRGGHQPEELVWYTLYGDKPAVRGVSELTIYRNGGGRFEQPPSTSAEAVGHARIWQSANGSLQASFAFDTGVESGLVIAQELGRVLPVSTAPGVRHWYDPAISGQGLLLSEPVEGEGHLFGGWFTYDSAGLADDPWAQHWFVIQGGPERELSSGLRRASIYRALGGVLGTQGTSNAQAIGEVELRPISCDRLEFTYRFDSGDLAGPFSGQSGTRVLRSIIGCP